MMMQCFAKIVTLHIFAPLFHPIEDLGMIFLCIAAQYDILYRRNALICCLERQRMYYSNRRGKI